MSISCVQFQRSVVRKYFQKPSIFCYCCTNSLTPGCPHYKQLLRVKSNLSAKSFCHRFRGSLARSSLFLLIMTSPSVAINCDVGRRLFRADVVVIIFFVSGSPGFSFLFLVFLVSSPVTGNQRSRFDGDACYDRELPVIVDRERKAICSMKLCVFDGTGEGGSLGGAAKRITPSRNGFA